MRSSAAAPVGAPPQTVALNHGFSVTITDTYDLLGSNFNVLVQNVNFVVDLLTTYVNFQVPLHLSINLLRHSDNPFGTDGLLPSAPAWVFQNGNATLAAIVKGQTGSDPNGATPDAGFTFYAGADGTLKNYGSPFWFDPSPQMGVAPSLPAGATDFIGVAIHELVHCMGFASWAAQNAPWNQWTVLDGGLWYYSSTEVDRVLGGRLPLAPAATASDHYGNTSLAYQPVRSGLMFQWGNYASNRLDLGQLDLLMLRDMGWSIKSYDALPLVDPLDAHAVSGTAGNNILNASALSSAVRAGGGNDTINLPGANGRGNYLLDGGGGTDTVVLNQVSTGYRLARLGTNHVLQDAAGLNGASLLRGVERLRFTNGTVALREAALADFNGEGTADLVLQAGGTVVNWLMQGGTYQSGNVLTTGAAGFTVVGKGDLDGDGDGDLVLQSGGTVVDWLLQNGVFQTGNVITAGAAGFTVVATGDLDGDGDADLVLQSGGTVVDWIMQNGAFQAGNVITTGASGFSVVGAGDLDGDGDADLVLQSGGTVVDWIMQNGVFQAGNVITSGATGFAVVGTGDLDGDGDADLILQSGGTVVAWTMQGGAYQSGAVITSGAAGYSVVDVGDYNADGTADIVLQSGGTVVNWIMQNGAFQSGNVITVGAAGFTVV